MPDRLPVGPYKQLTTAEGAVFPWYIMPFDKNGVGQAPLTRKHLVEAVANGGFTDVFLFSHGWNNDWKDASSLYEGFVAGYQKLRQERGLGYPRAFRPLLIGIFWPSTALVLPWEAGPKFAADADDQDQQVELERSEVSTVAEALDPATVERFYDLVQQGALPEAESRELAEIVAPIYASRADELAGAEAAPSADEILEVWRAAGKIGASEDTSGEIGEPGAPAGGPAAAGLLDVLDPRNLVRVATVWQMKDRAGVVGARGVSPLLREILQRTGGDTRIHLIGHSYGGKVMLSALCSGTGLPRRVNSVLLLQPAVSCLCFSATGAAHGKPGGYHDAPNRVEQPILTTFSSHDVPLTQVFHLAVRRKADLGETFIGGAPPSRYAALGGYGPAEADAAQTIEMPVPESPYPLAPGGPRILGLRGDKQIKGHGDISKPATWWALYCQVAGPEGA
jgi:hypothetical protein